ncbi:unnamed protein product, partial [Tetraodon nigroviridis]
GDITQKGYEKKRSKLIGAFFPQMQGMDLSVGQERRAPVTPSSSRYHRRRSSGTRDERYRSDVHTEAVQAALAKHKERKMAVPMPSKRRSLVVQSSMDAYTPPDTSSCSEGEGQGEEEEGGPGEVEDGGGGGGQSGTLSSQEGSISMERWICRAVHGTSSTTTTSSTASSSSSTHSGGSGAAGSKMADVLAQHVQITPHRLLHHHHRQKPENHSAPPDVTSYTNNTSSSSTSERTPGAGTAAQKQTPKYGNAELMETGDGVPVSSRVSAKIQQLVNTLKRPKRPPLREFFVDDFEELLEVQQPDPNQPRAEGAQMVAMQGEQLGVVTNWPPSLEAALQRWGTISPKAPCLTTMDTNGKPLYTLTYGKLWSRSVKVAYNLLHKLGNKQEPLVRPGDRVALVYPNNDPAAFMTAFYGCLLAEVVPVPIEVPLTRKDAGSQQIGFLLGSCEVTVALTSDACQKGLPKSPTGEIPQFRGWPKVLWFVTESKHLSKPPRDWFPHIKDANRDTAYIEYKTCKDGSVLGVTVTRIAMLTHCQALTQSCSYTEAETIVNVLDFKKDVGLWHAVQTSVMNMLHIISVPYALMKVNPLSWIQKVCQYKAKVACVKSRDMHWALVAHRDQRDVNLSSLRMLLVADGSNPWSISSCDAFLNVFQSKGLRSEVICPCASSPEALTVAIRRPAEEGSAPPGRGVLSMQDLSHGVIRIDSEEKLSVLTLQDVGSVMPGGEGATPVRPKRRQTSSVPLPPVFAALMCTVKAEGLPLLCKADEIGELVVCTVATGTSYYGLPGMTKTMFEVSVRPFFCAFKVFAPFHSGVGLLLQVVPASNGGAPISAAAFTRTGLLGFIGPAGLVFVAGKMDGLMAVGGRRHSADDIVATALAVEPMKFVYRGRIAVFSVTVLHDERIVVVAEQRPDSTEEDSFQWMSRVLQVRTDQLIGAAGQLIPGSGFALFIRLVSSFQAIDGIHQVGVYCLALVPSNTLPKTPLGGIHLSETKQLFLEGALHPCNVLMCPHTCVTNLPKPRQKQPEIGPASVMVGNLVSGKRIAQASGRDLGQMEDNDQARKFLFLSEVLQWRAQTTPDHVLYTLLNARGTVAGSLTCLQLHKRAEKIAALLAERRHLQDGDHVALVYPPGVDLIAAFYGCLYAGCVPVTVRPPHPQNIATTLPTVKMIVENDLPKKKPPLLFKPSNSDTLAYLDFSVSTTGMLAGVQMSHGATSAFCRSIKLQCELYPSREVALCLDPYCGLGFVLWCLCSVYSGHQSILIPPSELEANPSLWLSAVSQSRVRDTFCSYSVMELCTKGLGLQMEALKVGPREAPPLTDGWTLSLSAPQARGLDLSRVRTCVVVAEERPRTPLPQSFSKLFKDLGLPPRAVSTSFGCRVNLAICLQGTSGPDPTTVYVDMRALRHDRVRLVERGSPHSLPLMESGKILPGVRIIIANPETKGPMGESHLGEV